MLPCEIFKNGEKIVNFIQKGNWNFAILQSGEKLPCGDLGKIEIKCGECSTIKKINYRSAITKKKYVCQSCIKKGENNPFYGKTHSNQTKNLQRQVKLGMYEGKNNPFYGKTHSEETKKILSKKCARFGADNPFYGKTHKSETKKKIKLGGDNYRSKLTSREKKLISNRTKEQQKLLYKNNPKDYIEKRRKAGLASAKSDKNYKMNKLEKKFQDILFGLGHEFEYSVIINYMQFDFGNKDKRILIEINGDYWHGNPKFYGKNKRQLNETQLNKKKIDKKKQSFAKEYGFKLLTFWEYDIYNNEENIVETLKNEIN